MTPPPKRKPGFVLPVLKLQSSRLGGIKASIKGAGLSKQATERVRSMCAGMSFGGM